MAHEVIHLVGGPADGQTLAWNGGDWLEQIERPAIKLSLVGKAIPETVSYITHLYRRSSKDRTVFVWQP